MTTALATTAEFLGLLYGDDVPGWLSIFSDDEVTRWWPATRLAEAAMTAQAINQDHDVWYGVGLRSTNLGPGRRGGLFDIAALAGFWTDIDIAGPAHAQAALPGSLNSAQTLLWALPLEPSLVVHSGHGLQAYWLFKEPYVFDDDADRQRVEGMSRRWQALIRQLAQGRGWTLDNTSDLARLLRLPGTMNRKLDPVLVQVVERDDAARYDLGEIEGLLPDEISLGWVAPDVPTNDGDFPPAYLERILPQCAWLQHTVDDAATLREPEWYAQAGIVGRCVDGARQFHEISSNYPRYTPAETDRKLQHALKASSARTCAYIRSELGGESFCAQCRHWGTIKTPLVLGRPPEPTLILLNGNGHSDEEVPPAGETTVTPRRFALTDTGNAERLAHRYGEDIRHNWGRGVWHVWSGRHWEQDETGRMEQLAKQTVRAIPAEAAGLSGEQYTAILKWAIRSEDAGKRTSMVKLARAEEGIPVRPQALDTNPWLLNCRNGTIDLRTGELQPHRREDLITRLITVDYDPDAECPQFERFIAQIMGGDEALVAYVQRAVGYSLTGSIQEQCIFICHGTGSNGKSTLIGTLRKLLADYAREADSDSFMEKRGESIREDIAALDGARFVAASETGSGKRLSEPLVKKMTGGEHLRARRLYENGYEFLPQFKAWLSTNHQPTIGDTGPAIWRRLRLIPFNVTIPVEERDQLLIDKLAGELPGILAWAARGCLAWQQEGLNEPHAVLQATADYRRGMDLIGDWIETRCKVGPAFKDTSKELYADYVAHCDAEGETPVKQRTFAGKLTERGIGIERSNTTRLRTGIRLVRAGEAEQATLSDGMTVTVGDGNFLKLGSRENEIGKFQKQASPTVTDTSTVTDDDDTDSEPDF